jgi:hypothetical protein
MPQPGPQMNACNIPTGVGKAYHFPQAMETKYHGGLKQQKFILSQFCGPEV